MDLLTASDMSDLNLVKRLLQEGADVNLQDNNRWTALIRASSMGHLEIVKWLLEKGANIEHQNRWGRTALSDASQHGHLEIVKLLLEKGADIDHKDNFGETALMIASKFGYTNTKTVLYLKRYTDKSRAEILSGLYRTVFPLEMSLNEFCEYKFGDFEIYNFKL